MFLSIIIPVYNVERYLRKCLESCVNQDINTSEYEIIIVNDGSPDKSLDIANEYASKYNFVHVFCENNSGLSVARNTGVANSKGEYVWFVDSDDWIAPNSLGVIMDTIKRDNLDGLFIKGVRYVGNRDIHKPNYEFANIVMTGKELVRNYVVNCAAVMTIYRKQFLYDNKLEFYPGIFHEDLEFSPRAYYYLNRVEAINNEIYCNRLTENSITTCVNPKKGFDNLIVANSLDSFISKHVEEIYLKKYNDFVATALNAALMNASLMDRTKAQDFLKEWKRSKRAIRRMINTSRLKTVIEGLIFSIFPSSCIKLYKLIN